MPGEAGVYYRLYVSFSATLTRIKDSQRQYGFTSIGNYAATHHLRSTSSGGDQATAEAVGGATAHTQPEERPVRVLLLGPPESGQLVVSDLVVASGNVYDQKATVVVVLNPGADISLVDFAPAPGYFLFGVLRIIHNSISFYPIRVGTQSRLCIYYIRRIH